MTRYNSILFPVLILLGLAFTSCQNQQVDGCTDPTALNYDPNATQDDGSCQYAPTNNEAKVVFWSTQSTVDDYLSIYGVSSITMIIDGVSAGIHPLIPDAQAPACGALNRLTVTKTVPNGTLQYFPYFMIGQNNDTVAAGSFPFIGGTCTPIEIYD